MKGVRVIREFNCEGPPMAPWVSRLRQNTACPEPDAALPPVENARRYVVFRVADLVMAFRMDDVQQITSLVRWTPIPGGSPGIRGVANWDGQALCMIDLPKIFLSRVEASASERLIVMRASQEDHRAGLIVHEILDLSLMACYPDPEAAPMANFLPARELVTDRGGNAIPVLHMQTLLSPAWLAQHEGGANA